MDVSLQWIFDSHDPVGEDDQTGYPAAILGQIEEKYGITYTDVMKSSVAAFDAGAFKFKAEIMVDQSFENIQMVDFPGIFSLPTYDFVMTTYY